MSRPSLAILLCALLQVGCGGPEQTADPTPEPGPEPTATPAPTPTPEPLPPLSVDLHVDTVTEMVERQVRWDDPSLEAGLPALQSGGVDVIVEAVWIPRADPDPRGTALGKLRRLRAAVQASHGAAAIVTGPEQLERVVREGRIAVVLALEGGTALVDGEQTLAELRDLGLSMVGLTWTEASPYADSSAEERAGERGGLTDAGRAMVTLCNDLGLMLDVSHMSDRATAETLELSRAPVLASHSNARAVNDVPRNLPDDLLRRIAARGGLVGAMFHGPFVVAGRPSTRDDVVAQVTALVERIGAEHVGLGSDFDGRIKAPRGLRSARDLPLLREDLVAAGLTEAQTDLVMGDAFAAFWQRVWQERKR
jgi:membrane dipeptidase